MPNHTLGVCAIFQNEAPFLEEWIEFHRLMGVGQFYLYDNLSDDSSAEVLAPYCREGLVTLVPWPVAFEEFAQTRAYNDCLDKFGSSVRWLALLDVDEFLFSPEKPSLPDIMRDFESHPGVVVNWQIYGASGHVQDPGGLVIENFVQRAETQWVRNRRMKTILDPTRTVRVLSPHFAEYTGGALAVNEEEIPVRVTLRSKASGRRWAHWCQRARNRAGRELVRLFPRAPVDPYLWSIPSVRHVSVSRLRINHYAIKSVEQYVAKQRRRRDRGEPWTGLRVQNDSRFRYHDRNEVNDPILAAFADQLRQAISARRSDANAPDSGHI